MECLVPLAISRTARCDHYVIINATYYWRKQKKHVLELLGFERRIYIIYIINTLCQTQTNVKKKRHTKKNTHTKGHSRIWNVNLTCRETEHMLNHPISSIFRSRLTRDASIRTNRHLRSEQLFCKNKTKTAHPAGRRREHGRARPRQSRERRARWGTTSKKRTHRRTSSRANSIMAQNLA